MQKLTKTEALTPFLLNKYYHDLEPDEVMFSRDRIYNQAILVLDNDGPASKEKPYIREMDDAVLSFMTEYFSLYPVHKTNRMRLPKGENETGIFNELLGDFIKPKLILTFSREVDYAVSELYEVFMEFPVEETSMRMALIKIDGRYFLYICVAGFEEAEKKRMPYFMPDMKYLGEQAVIHLNILASDYPEIQPPDLPIKDKNVRKVLNHLEDYRYFRLDNVPPSVLSFLSEHIPDYDMYDIIILQQLYRLSGISFNEYAEKRKKYSSLSICKEHISEYKRIHQKQVLDMQLFRLWLFVSYPEESFRFAWRDYLRYKSFLEYFAEEYEHAKEKLEKWIGADE